MSTEIEKHIKSLSYGVTRGDHELIYKHHRALYAIGAEALPFIEEKILSKPWKDVKYRPQLLFLTGIFNLIHDIDEARTKDVAEKIRKAGCSDAVERRMAAIVTFTEDNFHVFESRGINIYQAKKLGEQKSFQRLIKKWFAVVPEQDIVGLERLYIVEHSDSRIAGQYTPILCKILVKWDMPFSRYNPLSWLFLFIIQNTFYHEIGHHVHNHTFGRDPEQEKEADKYAIGMLVKRYPILLGSVKWLAKIFKKLRKKPEDK